MAKIDERLKEYLKEVVHTGSAMVAVVIVVLMGIGAVVCKAKGIME